MRRAIGVVGFAALLLIAGVTEAPAVAFNTVGSIGSCVAGQVSSCAGSGGFVEVTPHPNWTPNIGAPGVGPVWVSYDQTGFGGSVVAPNAPSLSLADVTETFQMSVPAGLSSLSLLVWADDTVGVRLDNATSFLSPSSAGGMFTGPGTPVFIPLDGLGGHTIQFDAYQLGGFTFGLMVQGEGTEVPEPATLLLVGSTLAAAGVLSRRRLRKTQQLS